MDASFPLSISTKTGTRPAEPAEYAGNARSPKGLLDGLKHAGMLFDDNRFWCSHDAEIVFSRGENKWDRGTVIVIREEV